MEWHRKDQATRLSKISTININSYTIRILPLESSESFKKQMTLGPVLRESSVLGIEYELSIQSSK